MRVPHSVKSLALVFTACCTFPISAIAQQPQNQDQDVLKVNTSLVQTDVMVFDKQGKFVDNLKREQFVLKVDGKPREISFFELVKSGSPNEEAQLAAARGTTSRTGTPVPLDRGRSVFFFLDDLHLSDESLQYTRRMLTQFVESQMGQNDQVALITATGQIGFLQQLTDSKVVLLKAIERLRPRQYKATDFQNPPMTEYQALKIDLGDRDVLDVFVEQLLRDAPQLLGRARAEDQVKTRATSILRMSGAGTTSTLTSLQRLTETFRSAPGRKVMFFVSDGFLLDSRNSDSYSRLQRVVASASSSTFVIYSIDARGLVTGAADAGTPEIFDASGRLARDSVGEINALQNGLNALANDTGGRAFFNTNALSASVTKGLNDASVYYLVAWRPEPSEEQNPKQRRLELSVIGRGDLQVRSRSSVGQTNEVAKKKAEEKPVQSGSAGELGKELQAPVPNSRFPVHIALNSANTAEKGDVLITSIAVTPNTLHFEDKGGGPTARILFAGMILNEEGKIMDSFNKRLTVRAKSAGDTGAPPEINYTNYSVLKPGLYQVRVAAADEHGGPTASAWDWIEIPDFSAKKLALSSLVVGERPLVTTTSSTTSAGSETDSASAQVNLNVGRRFASSSYLRFMMTIYNPAGGAATGEVPAGGLPSAKPDLAVQVQVFRDNEPVVTDPLHRISTDGATDLTRIPYAAELHLESLAAGKYVLQVTVIDRIAKATASQRYRFQVD